MSYSIFDASVPVMIRALTNLTKILDKAIVQAKAQNIPIESLLEARLAPDMQPFVFQIRSASDAAKGCAAHLAGIEVPVLPDTETTFPELRGRLTKTIAFLQSIKPEQLVDSEDGTVVLAMPTGQLKLSGRDFLAGASLPNFFFHVTMAYALLRHKGITIGKLDFLGGT